EFDDAKDKVMMGAERRSMAMTEDEKMLTAYHEAGHAIVSLSVPGSDPVHKATIIPRGRALGLVQYLPERDRYSFSLEQMKARLASAMGGRVAEELKFGAEKVTSGASSDIEYVTRLARAMVTKYGLSDKLGPIAYAEEEGEVFLGQSIARTKAISSETAKMIEDEIKRFVTEGYEKARQILTERNADW
ncbi:MAG TPA: cell division protein FtsH, partial [Parvularcula sp.]|nr:cell division protein FtsH [Parvularcula sp.]HBS32652.1 cell division protein FtsH [Parvularcula sp.]